MIMYTVTVTYHTNTFEPAHVYDRILLTRANEFFHGKFKPGSDKFSAGLSIRELSFVFKKHYNAAAFQKVVLQEAKYDIEKYASVVMIDAATTNNKEELANAK